MEKEFKAWIDRMLAIRRKRSKDGTYTDGYRDAMNDMIAYLKLVHKVTTEKE